MIKRIIFFSFVVLYWFRNLKNEGVYDLKNLIGLIYKYYLIVEMRMICRYVLIGLI